MPRKLAPLTVCAAISAALLSGCGPSDRPATGQQTPAPATPPAGQPPASQPPALPTKPGVPAARKTLTREELKTWLRSSPTPSGWKPEDVKANFGKPDATTERKVGSQNATVWEYHKLTVDAAGSEKVDSVTRIVFVSGYTSVTRTEFDQ